MRLHACTSSLAAAGCSSSLSPGLPLLLVARRGAVMRYRELNSHGLPRHKKLPGVVGNPWEALLLASINLAWMWCSCWALERGLEARCLKMN